MTVTRTTTTRATPPAQSLRRDERPNRVGGAAGCDHAPAGWHARTHTHTHTHTHHAPVAAGNWPRSAWGLLHILISHASPSAPRGESFARAALSVAHRQALSVAARERVCAPFFGGCGIYARRRVPSRIFSKRITRNRSRQTKRTSLRIPIPTYTRRFADRALRYYLMVDRSV